MEEPAGKMYTYQERISCDVSLNKALDDYAHLYATAERTLFSKLAAGGEAGQLKAAFQKQFGLTARQFNALSISLKGKIASIKERRAGLIKEAETRIKKSILTIRHLEVKAEPGKKKRDVALYKLHQKQRRLETQKHRLSGMKADHEAGIVRICFGSKKLFNAQFSLEENGYADILQGKEVILSAQVQWKADWVKARDNSFFVIGSKDETGGCQGCVASVNEDGTLSLRVRLPDALITADSKAKHLHIPSIKFSYGHEAILKSLTDGIAISYRFVKDKKGWRVFASTEMKAKPRTSHKQLGSIGVDMNEQHWAVSEIDRFGNLVEFKRIDINLYGKTTDQREALLGDASKVVADWALRVGKPVIIEKLDFAKKKAELESVDRRQARMLSSFACSKGAEMLGSACFKRGVEIIEINPAYTSVIGAINHAQQHGISVHAGAALAIARRGLSLSERPTRRMGVVPVRNGDHITFSLPVGNRKKHVWSFWSKARTKLKAALAAHYRSGANKLKPAPLPPHYRASWATDICW
jgi:IS605 OrfB family transposase